MKRMRAVVTVTLLEGDEIVGTSTSLVKQGHSNDEFGFYQIMTAVEDICDKLFEMEQAV